MVRRLRALTRRVQRLLLGVAAAGAAQLLLTMMRMMTVTAR
jgi:hypothetical protein